MTEQLELGLEFDESSIPTNVSECPKPGLYPDPNHDDYRRWRGINSGVLRWGEISMAHMHAAFLGQIPNEDSPAKRFGRATHTRLLEPEKFASIVIAKTCAALLKTGERKGQACGKAGSVTGLDGEWYCGTHRPEACFRQNEFITEDERDRIERMAESIHSHPAMNLLKAPGWSECGVVYDWNGLPIKGRIDRYSQTAGFILDVKKCRVGYGTMELARKSIAEYGYMNQMAIYRRGVEVIHGKRPQCLWLFIEDGPPYQFQLVVAHEWELDHAWKRCEAKLSRYQSCCESGEFPGYVNMIHEPGQQPKLAPSHNGGYPMWMADKVRAGEM